MKKAILWLLGLIIYTAIIVAVTHTITTNSRAALATDTVRAVESREIEVDVYDGTTSVSVEEVRELLVRGSYRTNSQDFASIWHGIPSFLHALNQTLDQREERYYYIGLVDGSEIGRGLTTSGVSHFVFNMFPENDPNASVFGLIHLGISRELGFLQELLLVEDIDAATRKEASQRIITLANDIDVWTKVIATAPVNGPDIADPTVLMRDLERKCVWLQNRTVRMEVGCG